MGTGRTETNKSKSVIEIRDTVLDTSAILDRIQAKIAERRIGGAYQINPSSIGPETLSKFEEGSSSSLSTEATALQQAIRDLLMHSKLNEAQFTSSTPILGPLIVLLRRAWNWMSTKWYVLPVIKQQSDYNLQLGIVIAELSQQQTSMLKRIAELDARITELEKNTEQAD